eukprot:3487094-Rhodomonas_salina.2
MRYVSTSALIGQCSYLHHVRRGLRETRPTLGHSLGAPSRVCESRAFGSEQREVGRQRGASYASTGHLVGREQVGT